MRVMVIGKATDGTENGAGIDPEALEAMSRFNEELIDAGVLVALGGLTPSASGKRVVSDGGSRTVIDGPFAETKELVAGFMILEVEDMDEAMAWVMRAPHCAAGRSETEIRPLMGMAEFEAVQTPETRVIRERIRARLTGS
ncbi:YciI family protein [Frateuria sp. GZRe12]|uniref:YciI family protein n=1 Tax=Frateuria sp. GZRe12 TaxID=3351533 RepID=UPI003EDC3430